MTNPPCVKECKKRTITCKFDGTCDKYGLWKIEQEQERKKYNAIKQTESDLKDLDCTRREKRTSMPSTRNISQTR